MSGARGSTGGGAVPSAMEDVVACGASAWPTGAVVVAIGDVTIWGVLAWATAVGGLRGGSVGRARARVGSSGTD
jgi:hypothetical protein